MARKFKHLTHEQRCQISFLKQRGSKKAAMAKELGVDRSTIGRELKRNSDKDRNYRGSDAHERSTIRRRISASTKITPQLHEVIEEKLKLGWSPEQISGWIKQNGLAKISHVTIYTHIWQNKKFGGLWYTYLRHRGKKYNKKGKSSAGRGLIPGRVDIKERPAVVEEKSRFGDFELDTIIGGGHRGAIVSMVDRHSKYTKLIKVSQKTADEVKNAIIQELYPIREFVLTLTSDNGKEFAAHQEISKALEAQFYFATPYHSWERGLNEHTNGLVREYIPKGIDLLGISDEEIKRIEDLLNRRPRKILDFQTPLEVFDRLTKSA